MKKASLEPRPPRSPARPPREERPCLPARRGQGHALLLAARHTTAQAAETLEEVLDQLVREEARLIAASEGPGGREAAEMAGLLGTIRVDRLRPALEALRSLTGGSR